MTTVSGTFTANGASSTLRLGRCAEEVDYSITGPFDATVQLERALTPDESAWEIVAGPFTATAAGRYKGRAKDRLRLRVKDASISVTNGDFAAATGWTAGTGWAIADGVATRSASASTKNLDTTIATGLVAGASYVVTFDMTTSAGSLTVSLGGGTASDPVNEADDSVSVTLVAGATAVLRFTASDDYAGTVDNVTITPTFAYSFSDGDVIVGEVKDADGNVLETITQAGRNIHGDLTVEGSISLTGLTATLAELNSLDASATTQAITAAAAITLGARHVKITGPASSTYAVTLAAPTAAESGIGLVKVIEMIGTTSTNAVTLALTNVAGGSAATSASFDAAGEILVVVASNSKWVVLKEVGVTLS